MDLKKPPVLLLLVLTVASNTVNHLILLGSLHSLESYMNVQPRA